MALIDFSANYDGAPFLYGDGVLMRPPENKDYSDWRALRESSRAHLTRWEPDWTAEETTPQAFRQRIKAYGRTMRQGRAAPYFVFTADNARLVGGATLLNIVRGAAQSASLGYWIGAAHTRCGYGGAAVRAIVAFGFKALRLNRIEAACQPENTASRNLLRKVGFLEEGVARQYLQINGVWRDHALYAITAADWRVGAEEKPLA